jgi:hypothetical protein
MDPRHAPRMLGGPGTMPRSPRGHSAIVDLSERLRGNLRAAGDLRKRRRSRADLTEACGIRGSASLDADVRLERRIGARSPPRHPSPTGCVSLSVTGLSSGKAAMVLGGPVHCLTEREMPRPVRGIDAYMLSPFDPRHPRNAGNPRPPVPSPAPPKESPPREGILVR